MTPALTCGNTLVDPDENLGGDRGSPDASFSNSRRCRGCGPGAQEGDEDGGYSG